jgi:hypothetical protein
LFWKYAHMGKKEIANMNTTVTTNPPEQPNAVGGAPTTTSNVDGTITPNPTTAAPDTTSANPQTNPTTAAPATNQPTTAQPSQNQPHPVSKMFDSILKTISGGPIYVNDPVTGQRREVQQTKGSMARAITAAALSGLFTPNQYRPGPFGGSVLDKGNTMAAAGQAGMQAREKREQAAQTNVDQAQARQLFTIQNNAKLVQQAAAMAHQKHEVLADTVKTNQTKFMGPLADFDASRPSGTPSIFSAKGQTSEEVLAGGHKLHDANVFIDGTTQKPNELGVIEDVPTYAVIRSTNADGSPITLKLPEEVTQELGKYSKPYEQAYAATGGNVLVPINNYMDAIHTYHTLNSVESFMNRVQKDVNPTGTKVNLVDAYKNDPTGYWNAINSAEQAIAAGNGRPGEDTEDNVLTRVAATPGGAKLLDLVGTPQQVEAWRNKLTSQRALAKEGGMGDKAPAPKGMVDDQVKMVQGSDLPPEIKTNLLNGVPELSGGQSNMKQAEQFRDRVATALQNSTRNRIQSGDPDMIAQQTKATIGAGDLTDAKSILSSRGNAKEAYNIALENKAEELGLNPQHFNVGALERKSKTADAFAPQGKIGQQLSAFKKFGEHAADAKDANDAWQRASSPIFNKSLGWLAQNAENDQNYQRFRASIIAPAKEYMNFLNQNRAEHETDIAALESILNDKATPATAYTALQTFMKTADDQAYALGEQYRDAVGTTFPALVSKSTADAMRKLGVTSRSVDLSGTLPRAQSWVTNLQPQTLNPSNQADRDIVTKFLRSAGKDSEKAMEMGREHGYIFTLGQ